MGSLDLRILFVDDSEDDVSLMLRRLREAGIDPRWERVEAEPALRAALADGSWDLALVDYNLPGFGGLQALHVLAEVAAETPAITVSGAISEDTAVATITAGAVDYVLKDNLTRLAPAVQRAVEGADLRRRQRRDAEQARQSQFAVDHASQAIVYVSEEGVLLYVNAAAERLGGVPREEAIGQRIWRWIPLVDERRWAGLWRAAAERPIVDFETTVRHAGGEHRLVTATIDRLERDGGAFAIAYVRDVTAEREAEQRAAETEARYGRLTDNVADIVFRYDLTPSPGLTYINPAVEVVTGYTPEECYADPQLMLHMAHPDDASLMAGLLQSLDPPDEPIVMRWIGKDGVTRWMESRLVPVRDAEGRLVAVEGITRDVSERIRTQDALSHSHDLLEYVVAHARSAIAIHDRELRYIYVSDRYLEDYGVEEQDVIGKHHYDVFPDLPQKWRDVHQRALAGEVSSAEKDPYPRADGSVDWTRWECRPWYEADGSIGGIIVYTEVITERVLAEEALRASEQRFAEFAGRLPGRLWMRDRDLRYLYVNRQLASDLGVVEGDLLGKTPEDLWDEKTAAVSRQMCERALAGEIVDVVERWPDEEGSDWYRSLVFSLAGAGDEAMLGGFTFDITEQHAAQEALRESEAHLRTLVDTLPDLVWLKDLDGVYLSCNRRFESFFGAAEADIAGKTDYDFTERRLADAFREHDRAAAAAGGPSTNEEEIVFAEDGHTEVLETIKTPVLAADGRVIGILGVGRDITARKRGEEELARSLDLLSNLARLVPGVIYQYRLYPDGSSAFPYASRGMNDIYEVTPEEVREDATAVFGRLHPDDRDRVTEAIFESARTLETFHCEFRVVLPRQGLRWRWSQAHPERTEDGGTLWHGIISDITERKLAEEEIRRQAEQLKRIVEGAVLAMSHVVETRDPYTAGHERRVAELAVAVGAEMGMGAEELDGLRLAGLIHDIGKIAVPAEILSKPGRLSAAEFNLIKQHARSGYDILAAIEFERPVAEIVLQHHERLDGSGYPQALTGEDILPEARILAVADVVEAMSSHRPYRPALGVEPALAEIRENAGVKYDVEVAAACLRVIEEQDFAFTP